MSAVPFFLAPGDLVEAFPQTYLERGERYFREGRVLMVNHDAARGLTTARVRGSGGRVYQCIVQLAREADGAIGLIGQCSCPVGFNCKHVAAALLSLGAQTARSPEQPRPAGLSLEARGWLERLERLTAYGASEDPHRLLFLVRPEERFGLKRLLVRAVRVRRLQTGGYGKPQDFNIHGQSRAGFVAPEDQRIMALIQAGRGGGSATETNLTEETGADALRAIAVSGRGHWLSADGPALSYGSPIAGRLTWTLEADTRLHLVLESDRPGIELLPLTPPWYLDPESGECGPLQTGLGDREAGLLAMAPAVPSEAADAFRDAARERLKGLSLPLPSRPEHRRVERDTPVPCLSLQSEELAAASVDRYWGIRRAPEWSHGARLTFEYGGASVVDPRVRDPLLTRVEQGVLLESERDLAAEAAAFEQLKALGFAENRDFGDSEGLCLGLPDERAWLRFMGTDAPRLRAAGWRVESGEGFRFQIVEAREWQAEIAEADGGRWLDLGLGVEVEGERLDLLPLLVDLIRRVDFDLSLGALARMDEGAELPVRLDDGRLLLMPVRRLRPILSTLIELYDSERPLTRDGRLRLPRQQAVQLVELEGADLGLDWRGGESVLEWGRRLRDFHGPREVAPPAGLAAELRPYQRQGVDWLQLLREHQLGGILADDMGLGKTVQALAHLLIEKESGRADRPSLVVAPTSLMFNWRREAERFAPSLRVLLLHGADRHARFQSIAEHDLVLTTYPLLPRDLDALASVPLHLLILDEAQAVKNPRSKAAEAVRSLDARHRLCLTGTPLENHLGELWALLDFLMPEMLGDERRFRRLFRTPIERHGDEGRQEQLRRRVAPFLLRRTKEAVAAELPPKTEILREVSLADDQRDLYETLRLALHERVRLEVERKGLARSGIIILDALLKLRQVCCDPRLVALESARRVRGSAKLELLMDLLPELLEEGRRVLLFSQFTSMLALIEEALMHRGMCENRDFIKLTGRTRNRALPVDRFQAREVPLFLISLKAGGSGLNLTAADTVIHYDPWWNPAAERQATDRAHRIGQDKPVFVYKLLTEGTVEQRVAEMQARKQALADAMLAGGGAAAGALSPEDLELLFAPIAD